jgi:hypothetical protein
MSTSSRFPAATLLLLPTLGPNEMLLSTELDLAEWTKTTHDVRGTPHRK